MRCQTGTYSASGTQLLREGSQTFAKFNAVGGMLSICRGKDLLSYVSTVEYYSQRKLTKQEDKMDVFQGIFRKYDGKMDGMRLTFVYGFPKCAFDQTFCWRPHQHNPHLRNQIFPSWSWLGWNDAVSFDREMLRTARTSYMICRPNQRGDGVVNTDEPRNPASRFSNKLSFPTATSGVSYNNPERYLDGSITDLCIALEPLESKGSNSRYAVFPSRCSQQLPPTPPEMTSLREELLSRAKNERMEAKTAAAPSIPTSRLTEQKHDFTEHNRHEECEVQTPFRYIWLDRKWREQQPDSCAKEFLALMGKKHPDKQGECIITMLMCLQRTAKNGDVWARERVQVMDCEIEEERWLRTGARPVNFKLA